MNIDQSESAIYCNPFRILCFFLVTCLTFFTSCQTENENGNHHLENDDDRHVVSGPARITAYYSAIDGKGAKPEPLTTSTGLIVSREGLLLADSNFVKPFMTYDSRYGKPATETTTANYSKCYLLRFIEVEFNVGSDQARTYRGRILQMEGNPIVRVHAPQGERFQPTEMSLVRKHFGENPPELECIKSRLERISKKTIKVLADDPQAAKKFTAALNDATVETIELGAGTFTVPGDTRVMHSVYIRGAGRNKTTLVMDKKTAPNGFPSTLFVGGEHKLGSVANVPYFEMSDLTFFGGLSIPGGPLKTADRRPKVYGASNAFVHDVDLRFSTSPSLGPTTKLTFCKIKSAEEDHPQGKTTPNERLFSFEGIGHCLTIEGSQQIAQRLFMENGGKLDASEFDHAGLTVNGGKHEFRVAGCRFGVRKDSWFHWSVDVLRGPGVFNDNWCVVKDSWTNERRAPIQLYGNIDGINFHRNSFTCISPQEALVSVDEPSQSAACAVWMEKKHNADRVKFNRNFFQSCHVFAGLDEKLPRGKVEIDSNSNRVSLEFYEREKTTRSRLGNVKRAPANFRRSRVRNHFPERLSVELEIHNKRVDEFVESVLRLDDRIKEANNKSFSQNVADRIDEDERFLIKDYRRLYETRKRLESEIWRLDRSMYLDD